MSTDNVNIIVKKLDLSSQASIRDFCKEIIETETKLDVLIHNAGYGGTFAKSVSVDGIGKEPKMFFFGSIEKIYLFIYL